MTTRFRFSVFVGTRVGAGGGPAGWRPARPGGAAVARRRGRRRYAPAQRLDDCPGRHAPRRGRSAAQPGRNAGPSLRGRHQQRLGQADADDGGFEAPPGHGHRAGGERLVRAGVGPRRYAAVLGRWRQQRRLRVHLREGQAQGARDDPARRARAQAGLAAAPAERLRRRPGGEPRRPPAVHPADARRRPHRGRSRHARGADAGRPRGRALRRGAVARRLEALRVAVGRGQGGRVRRPHPRAARRDRDRRAPERDGLLEGRPSPVRRLRQPQHRVGDRRRLAQGGRADLDRALPARAGRLDAQRAGALARRRDAGRGQRRQQHRGPGGRAGTGPARWRASSRRGGIRPACCSTTAGGACSC